MTTDVNAPAGDLMLGAKAIAAFLNELFGGEPFTAMDVYNWCNYGKLPHSKHGNQIVASKRKIREHFYAADAPTVPKRPW